jgi:hypothetical protein
LFVQDEERGTTRQQASTSEAATRDRFPNWDGMSISLQALFARGLQDASKAFNQSAFEQSTQVLREVCIWASSPV